MPAVNQQSVAVPGVTPGAVPGAVIEWLGLRLELPRPWEVVRHGVSPRKGSLVFADRARQRLQVTWTACVKKPDVGRLLDDHRDRQKAEQPDAEFVPATLPIGWRGLERRFDDGRSLLRAARYDTGTDRLLEAVLEVDRTAPDEIELADDVLRGIRVVSDPASARRVRAFGIDADLPAGWRLGRTRVLPADTSLMFVKGASVKTRSDTAAASEAEVTLRRRAMADVWFDGDPRALLQRDEPRASMNFTETQANGHAAVAAAWDVPGPRYERLLRQNRVAIARLWHCPADNTLYQLTAVGPVKRPPTLDGFGLSCCGAAAGGRHSG